MKTSNKLVCVDGGYNSNLPARERFPLTREKKIPSTQASLLIFRTRQAKETLIESIEHVCSARWTGYFLRELVSNTPVSARHDSYGLSKRAMNFTRHSHLSHKIDKSVCIKYRFSPVLPSLSLFLAIYRVKIYLVKICSCAKTSRTFSRGCMKQNKTD